MNLSREGDKLLQEFMDVCQEPNSAEIEMLAKACRAPEEIVSTWCKSDPGRTCIILRADTNQVVLKRDRTRRLFVAKGLATQGSRLGTKLRKREFELRTGPPLRAAVPAEFSDPDLNEGWYNEEEVGGVYS